MEENTPIGTAIIVKDSQQTICRALVSVKKISSQIVVVDTGSSDNTPLLCTRAGVDIYFKKWNDNFSDARNYALQFIRTDWVISLDADEELDSESFLLQKHLLNNNKIGGLKVKIINYLSEEDSLFTVGHSYTRIFRVNKNIRFTGKIHEQINDSIINSGYEIIDTDIIIKHFGYINNSPEKNLRNKKLLNEELSNNPNDSWLKYHLAQTEFASKNFDKAQILFETALNSQNLAIEQIENSNIRLAQIALGRNNFDDAIKFTNFKSNNVDIEGLRKFILGIIMLYQKLPKDAEIYLNSPDVFSSTLVEHSHHKQLLDIILKK